MIIVNGKEEEAQEGETALSLLERLGYRVGVIVVEPNGKILQRAEYAETKLRDGDRIEAVSFVGGG